MKRVIAGLASATAATLIAAVPAQAAAPHAAPAPDPVAAVKKYFVPGEGVRFIDRATSINGKSHTISARHTGTYLFGKSGIVASDISGNFNSPASDEDDSDNPFATPERTVTVGGATYLSGSVWDSLLPEGKTWMKMVEGFPGVIGVNRQPVNVIEPATLKALLADSKRIPGGYAGKITEGALQKLSPSYRALFMRRKPTSALLKSVISWRLTVDAKGLPTRMVSTSSQSALDEGVSKTLLYSVDTRFTGWGDKVEIKAPPADQASTEFADVNPESASLPVTLDDVDH